jgi:hypothetical protein
LKEYKIKSYRRLDDIQEGIRWYNSCQEGLGLRFMETVEKDFNILRLNPHFQVRYDNVRCLPVKIFPYMIHFIIEEDARRIVILGVICTLKDPDKWSGRQKIIYGSEIRRPKQYIMHFLTVSSGY